MLEDFVDLGARQRTVPFLLRGEPAEPLPADELSKRRLAGFAGPDEDLRTGGNREEESQENEKRRAGTLL
ncbi:MAG: hypothetical protein ACHQJD_06200 [Thermoanaerobaculia bacterium]